MLPSFPPSEIVWVEDRQVPIYYVDYLPNHSEHTLGFYEPNLDTIFILDGKQYTWAMPGCTVRQHEILHAWGYDHVNMHQFNCPHYSEASWNPMQYESENIHHWNPNYLWDGYGVEHRVIWR